MKQSGLIVSNINNQIKSSKKQLLHSNNDIAFHSINQNEKNRNLLYSNDEKFPYAEQLSKARFFKSFNGKIQGTEAINFKINV